MKFAAACNPLAFKSWGNLAGPAQAKKGRPIRDGQKILAIPRAMLEPERRPL
jgi:hypothetical protein